MVVSGREPVAAPPLEERRPFRAPWALLLAAVLFAALEWLSGRAAPAVRIQHTDTLHERFYDRSGVPGIESSVVQWQTHRVLHARDPFDVVLTGDSSCLMGLKPKLIESATGLRTTNLGTLGYLWPDGHLELFDLFVDRHGPPRVVVLHLAWETLAREAATPGNDWWIPAFRRWLRLEPRRGQWSNPASFLPSFRFRDAWGQGFSGLLAEGDVLRPAPYDPRFMAAPRGPFPSDDAVRSQLDAESGYIPEPRVPPSPYPPLDKPLAMSPAAPAALRAWGERARRHGFELLVVFGPFPESMRTPDLERQTRAIAAELRAAVADLPQVQLDADPLRVYPNELVSSITHLLEPGAERNSAEVAGLLEQRYPQVVRASGLKRRGPAGEKPVTR